MYLGINSVIEDTSWEAQKSQLRKGGFVDVPRIISFLKARSYMGRGIEFKHKDKKIHDKWHKFVELNDFFSHMFESIRIKDEVGAVFECINITKGGMAMVSRATPLLASRIGFSFATPSIAVINIQIGIGNRQVYCRQVYDIEKIVRTFWALTPDGKEEIFNESATVDKNLQLELGTFNALTGAWTYYHNLGFVPVEVIYNEPFTPNMPILTAGFYYQSPFTTPQNLNNQGFDYSQVKSLAKCSKLPLQLDNLYIHMNRLVELYKPRLIITSNNAVDGNPYLQNKLRQQGLGGNNSNIQDADIFTSTQANKIEVDTQDTPNTIDNYQNQIVATWIDIFKAVGLSFVTQSGTQKTGQESFTQYKGDIEDVNFQRNYLTNKWINIIIKCFKVMNVDLTKNKEDWSFQVKKNLATDENSLVDSLIKQYGLKLKTPAEILSVIEGIDQDYAEHIVKENFKWFEEHKEETIFPQINPPANANVSGVKSASLPGSKEKGGRPEQKGAIKNEK